MDELELIRSFRRAEAIPNPVARAAARDRLIAHIADDHLVAESSAQLPTPPSKTRTVSCEPQNSRARSESASEPGWPGMSWERSRPHIGHAKHRGLIVFVVAAIALAPHVIAVPFMDPWTISGAMLIVGVGVLTARLSASAVILTATSLIVLSLVSTVLLRRSPSPPPAVATTPAQPLRAEPHGARLVVAHPTPPPITSRSRRGPPRAATVSRPGNDLRPPRPASLDRTRPWA
jgi:hypothetical protein